MIAEMENHLAILGFLLLVGAYGLASDFDKNELESLCCSIPKHANVTHIHHVLGISSEIPMIKKPTSHSNGEPLSNIVERRSKQQNIISGCTSSVIHCASDPAKIVLDALRKCYYAELESSIYVCTRKRKRGKSKDAPLVMERLELSLAKQFVRRFSDVLEQLREVSPEIRPQVKVEATEFAVEWRAALIDPLEGLAFLQLLATFQLSSSFDSDDLVGVLEIVQHKKKAISLIKILGLADKIPSLIENLIRKDDLVLAFTYIYEFELVGSFSPVLLLKNYVLHSTEQAKQTDNGCCPHEVQNKVKAAVKSIEQHGIQSGYSPIELRVQILEIERLMARPHESLCAPNPHAGVSTGGCTSVIPNSSHFTQHFVPDPRVRPSNFRAPSLHPSLFLQHNRLDAPPGGMFRNFSGSTDHFLAPSGVPRPLPIVNPFYHQQTPCSPNVIHPSYFP